MSRPRDEWAQKFRKHALTAVRSEPVSNKHNRGRKTCRTSTATRQKSRASHSARNPVAHFIYPNVGGLVGLPDGSLLAPSEARCPSVLLGTGSTFLIASRSFSVFVVSLPECLCKSITAAKRATVRGEEKQIVFLTPYTRVPECACSATMNPVGMYLAVVISSVEFRDFVYEMINV